MNINKILKKMNKNGISLYYFYTADILEKVSNFFQDEEREVIFLKKFKKITSQYEEYDSDGYTVLNLPNRIKR